MKTWVVAMLAVWLCGGCAEGGPSASGPQGGSVTMYGTMDAGVAFVK